MPDVDEGGAPFIADDGLSSDGSVGLPSSRSLEKAASISQRHFVSIDLMVSWSNSGSASAIDDIFHGSATLVDAWEGVSTVISDSSSPVKLSGPVKLPTCLPRPQRLLPRSLGSFGYPVCGPSTLRTDE